MCDIRLEQSFLLMLVPAHVQEYPRAKRVVNKRRIFMIMSIECSVTISVINGVSSYLKDWSVVPFHLVFAVTAFLC